MAPVPPSGYAHDPIALSGYISMQSYFEGNPRMTSFIFLYYHNLSFKTDRKSKQTLFYFFECMIDTEGASDDVIFSICGIVVCVG